MLANVSQIVTALDKKTDEHSVHLRKLITKFERHEALANLAEIFTDTTNTSIIEAVEADELRARFLTFWQRRCSYTREYAVSVICGVKLSIVSLVLLGLTCNIPLSILTILLWTLLVFSVLYLIYISLFLISSFQDW